MAANPTLILGSASPRRVALLNQLQLDFVQLVSPAEEPAPGNRGPAEHVVESARLKAQAVAALAASAPPTPLDNTAGLLIIGADTVVCVDGAILGKPTDETHAMHMLRTLSGRSHEVYTGVALRHSNGWEQSVWELTQVQMRKLTEQSIRSYVDSGEPLDKAGGYAIQGLGARFVEHISGCYYNVVGLPLARLCALLEEAGYDFGSR
jgi:septum formation protein